MKSARAHLRGNAVAYLALFVALGGTSYAAVNQPRNSVGTRQLRNGAVTALKLADRTITPSKLNSKAITASVSAFAAIDAKGGVHEASEPAHTVNWGEPGPTGIFETQVVFAHPFPTPRFCFALASVQGVPGDPLPTIGSANATIQGKNAVSVYTYYGNDTEAPLPVVVAVLCPSRI